MNPRVDHLQWKERMANFYMFRCAVRFVPQSGLAYQLSLR